ncbi:MAG: formate dehydrogenase subunit delta [Burkholderiales bacterium]
MNNDNLIRMVNRIGAFFAAMPDREEAMRDIAQHVRRFWEPRMRKQLFVHLDEQQGEGVDALVLAALRQHRALFS